MCFCFGVFQVICFNLLDYRCFYSFQEEYRDFKQISSNDIQSLVMRVHGVTGKRSIQNRVEYLKGLGLIEPFAPNVYN
jgi:hypothetical protein